MWGNRVSEELSSGSRTCEVHRAFFSRLSSELSEELLCVPGTVRTHTLCICKLTPSLQQPRLVGNTLLVSQGQDTEVVTCQVRWPAENGIRSWAVCGLDDLMTIQHFRKQQYTIARDAVRAFLRGPVIKCLLSHPLPLSQLLSAQMGAVTTQ